MKSTLLGFLVALAGIQANARSVIPSLQGNLTNINIDQGSDLAKRDIASGNIKLDFLKSTVTLTLQPAMPSCPQGALCSQMMPSPIEVTLPLLSAKNDACGSAIYTAKEDMRPVEGVFREVVVKDNKANKCLTEVALPPVEITYTISGFNRLTGQSFRYINELIAEPLHP